MRVIQPACNVSDSDTSWHDAGGEQLQCVYYYYFLFFIFFKKHSDPSLLSQMNQSTPAGIQASYSRQMVIITSFFQSRWAGLAPIHTLVELYYLLIYLSLCHWIIRQNTGETGTSSWLSNTEWLFSTEPCYFLVIWHWRQPVTSTGYALTHSLWNWLGCIFLQTFGLFTYLQMFTKAAMHCIDFFKTQ